MTPAHAAAGRNIKIAAENREESVMKKTLIRLLFGLFAILVFTGAAFAWNPSDEVMRLNKESPSFDTFGNPAAVIWQRNEEINLREDGATEKTKHYIVSFGERIPASLSIYAALAPADGDVQITHAGIYNPMNGVCEMKLEPAVFVLSGGLRINVVKVPDAARGRIFVVEEKSVSASSLNETISMAAQFPVWEQNVRVEAPAKTEIYWFGNELRDPETVKLNDKRKVYSWSVTNQPAWHGTGLVVLQRPYLSLTMNPDLRTALLAMEKKAEEYAKCGISAPAGDTVAMMKWLDDPSRNEKNLPPHIIRSVKQLPASGPWTMSERTLLLSGWLHKKGTDSKIWWQAPTVVSDNSTVAEDFWNMPVIVVGEGKKSVYYHSGQGVAYGAVSPFLAGTDIYRAKEKKGVATKEIKAGNPANHKLTMNWNLKLAPSGTAEGTLTAIVEGAWAGLFSNGIVPGKDIAAQLMASRVNFALPGMTLTPTSIKTRESGYRIDFNVKCVPGIAQKKNLLVRLPGGIPEILGELINETSEFTFRFPFMIEQKVRMSTPKGYKLFQPEVNHIIGTKKTSQLTEKIRSNDVKNILEAECVWVVKNLKIHMEDANVLKQQVSEILRWPALNLPYRKK